MENEMAKKKIDIETTLLAQIETLKTELARLGEIRSGVLSEQYNVCGKKGCRCKDKENPRKHGPYFQLSYTWNGRGTSEFVKAPNLEAVRQQMADYKRFGEIKDEWTGASIELARLRRERIKAAKSK